MTNTNNSEAMVLITNRANFNRKYCDTDPNTVNNNNSTNSSDSVSGQQQQQPPAMMSNNNNKHLCVGDDSSSSPSSSPTAPTTTTTNIMPIATSAIKPSSAGSNSPNGTLIMPPISNKMGSRRIFSPQFKIQVLESYRNDSDCKGNQRATARKYGIHRRQIQKWLQCEDALRTSALNNQAQNGSHSSIANGKVDPNNNNNNNSGSNNNKRIVQASNVVHHHHAYHQQAQQHPHAINCRLPIESAASSSVNSAINGTNSTRHSVACSHTRATSSPVVLAATTHSAAAGGFNGNNGKIKTPSSSSLPTTTTTAFAPATHTSLNSVEFFSPSSSSASLIINMSQHQNHQYTSSNRDCKMIELMNEAAAATATTTTTTAQTTIKPEFCGPQPSSSLSPPSPCSVALGCGERPAAATAAAMLKINHQIFKVEDEKPNPLPPLPPPPPSMMMHYQRSLGASSSLFDGLLYSTPTAAISPLSYQLPIDLSLGNAERRQRHNGATIVTTPNPRRSIDDDARVPSNSCFDGLNHQHLLSNESSPLIETSLPTPPVAAAVIIDTPVDLSCHHRKRRASTSSGSSHAKVGGVKPVKLFKPYLLDDKEDDVGEEEDVEVERLEVKLSNDDDEDACSEKGDAFLEADSMGRRISKSMWKHKDFPSFWHPPPHHPPHLHQHHTHHHHPHQYYPPGSSPNYEAAYYYSPENLTFYPSPRSFEAASVSSASSPHHPPSSAGSLYEGSSSSDLNGSWTSSGSAATDLIASPLRLSPLPPRDFYSLDLKLMHEGTSNYHAPLAHGLGSPMISFAY